MNKKNFSRRKFIQTTALALPAFAAATPLLGWPNKNDFVTVRNGHFELRGKPHFYVGTNMWYACYLCDPKLKGGRARFVRELDRLKALGATNIRLLAGSETSPLAGAIPRGITRGPGDYDEDLLSGLDFALAEMGKRDMRGILFMSNYWQWSGGFAQYVRWVTGDTIPDPDKPVQAKGDWSGFMRFSARIYKLAAANQLYLDYVASLIQRRNTVTGRIYRDDPAIMTWELANEPRPGTDANTADVPAFATWVDATSRFIHEHDPNHLVCTGNEGIHGSLDSDGVFIQAHASPAVDYVTVHTWLKNWRWLTKFELGPVFDEAVARMKDHLEHHNVIATDTLRKPLVLEEFGLPRDHENYEPGSPTTARDEYYRQLFDQAAESAKKGRALQAANFWAWGGEGRVGGELYSAGAFMGDPFSEPQGLNSVFDVDKSTLEVISKSNAKFRAMAG
jgi:mannan endo-1,4-beta-mannosidase